MKEKILQELNNIKVKTGNNNGLTPAQLHNMTGINISEIRNILNKLYTDGVIKTHDTAHGKAVKLK